MKRLLFTYFAIGSTGTLWAWGDSQWGTTSGQYESAESGASYESAHKIMENAVFVTSGQFAAMAIDDSGTLWGWGSGVSC